MQRETGLNVFIFANCHGMLYKRALKEGLGLELSHIEHVISYENLNNYSALEPKFAACDVLIIQPVKNYPLFRMENLEKVVRKDCLIIRVPFVRFEGFWAKNDARRLNNISPAAVEDFPALQGPDDVDAYLAGDTLSKEQIKAQFDESLGNLRKIESEGDIKFMDFFLKHYRNTPLFRDSYHPTVPLYQHLASQIVEQVVARFPEMSSGSDRTDSMTVGKEYGHFKPIRDRVVKTLELEYDPESYFIYSRADYLKAVLWLEQHAAEPIKDLVQFKQQADKLIKAEFQLAQQA